MNIKYPKFNPPYNTLNKYGNELQNLLENKIIDEEIYFKLITEATNKAYLSRNNPRAQSGHSGDEYGFHYSRMMILESINKSGTFIDIGCANGHLIECLNNWLYSSLYKIKFYGIDISEELIKLAQIRLPKWKNHFFIGNSLYWVPRRRFDFVYTMILPDIPKNQQKYFFEHLFNEYVKPSGRLILGPWNEKGLEEKINKWGYKISGYCEKSFNNKSYKYRRLVWFVKIK